MRTLFLTLALLAPSVPAPASATGWTLEPGQNSTALVFGTPAVDRDAFRIDCGSGMLTLSTWARSPPRGVAEGTFPTTLSVFFGNRERVYTASGRVTGPGTTTRVDARIADPAAFLTSLDGVQRLTTVIFAGRRMAPIPAAAQTADLRKACGL